MKDILKIMHFDLLTALPAQRSASEYILAVFMIIISIGLPLFIFPAVTCCYMMFAALLIVPLQSAAEKSGLNKLYGVLPVKRKNITRARFLYIFSAHVIMEAAALIMLVVSVNVRLYEITAFVEKGGIFNDPELLPEMVGVILGWFIFLCFTFTFMEMVGQIHGRQNEMKVLFIMIAAVCVIVLGGVFILSQLGYPELNLDMPAWAAVLFTNIGMLGVCVLFGEITASKLAKREL